jgi:hypothetical protein
MGQGRTKHETCTHDKLLFLVVWYMLVGSSAGLLYSKKQNSIRHRDESDKNVRKDQSPPILCRVYKETTILSNQFSGLWDEENFLCSPVLEEESDVSYKIDLPPVIGNLNLKEAESGSFFLNVYSSRIEADSIVGFSRGDLEVAAVPFIRQRKLQTSGKRTVLVLRVSLDDSEPEFTAAEFRDRIFGFDEITMQSQYFKCSAGKLTLQPADVVNGTENRIENGILEVRLSEARISDFATSTSLSNAAQMEAANLLRLAPGEHISSLSDHIMICLPPGTGNWVAAAATNHWRSVYNNKFCGILSASMHEIG